MRLIYVLRWNSKTRKNEHYGAVCSEAGKILTFENIERYFVTYLLYTQIIIRGLDFTSVTHQVLQTM